VLRLVQKAPQGRSDQRHRIFTGIAKMVEDIAKHYNALYAKSLS
jgi:hypothetical protein